MVLQTIVRKQRIAATEIRHLEMEARRRAARWALGALSD
jgi:hypothetical protein